jgi:phosphopantothenoylcysteine decarboxylase/phosphopantothenate--cysteine ligase
VKKQKRVVLGVTGSIAAYKAADIIRRLSDKGFKVSVIMTGSAEHFITPLTLSRLSGEKVYTKMFDSGYEDLDIEHISLGKAADIILIAPATANIIGKLAGGIADDVLTCTCLSTNAPILIAPAMNPLMYKNKIVQENCNKLKASGFLFVGPIHGKVACGDSGEGHIACVDDIVDAVIRSVKK